MNLFYKRRLVIARTKNMSISKSTIQHCVDCKTGKATEIKSDNWMFFVRDVFDSIVEYHKEAKGELPFDMGIVHLFDAPTCQKREELMREWERSVSHPRRRRAVTAATITNLHTSREEAWATNPMNALRWCVKSGEVIPEWFVVTKRNGEKKFSHVGLQRLKAGALILRLEINKRLCERMFGWWRLNTLPQRTSYYFAEMAHGIEHELVNAARNKFQAQWRKKAGKVAEKYAECKVAQAYAHSSSELLGGVANQEIQDHAQQAIEEIQCECALYAGKILELMRPSVASAVLDGIGRAAQDGVITSEFRAWVQNYILIMRKRILAKIQDMVYRDMYDTVSGDIDNRAADAFLELSEKRTLVEKNAVEEISASSSPPTKR